MGERIAVKCRLRWPFLNEARPGKAGPDGKVGKAKFSICGIVPEDDAAVKELEAIIVKVAQEKWTKDAANVLKAMKAQGKYPLYPGDAKAGTPGFENSRFFNASNEVRPTLKDRRGNTIAWADGILYEGCYVVAHLEAWAMDNAHGKRVNFSLRGVQYFAKGDAFGGGGAAADDEFKDLGTEEGEIDPTA